MLGGVRGLGRVLGEGMGKVLVGPDEGIHCQQTEPGRD